MTPEDVFAAWAPSDSPWSDWAKPVLFAQLPAAWGRQDVGIPLPALELGAFGSRASTAIVVDLGGEASVIAGLALARQGYRPIPVFNGAAAGEGVPLASVDAPFDLHTVAINVWPLMRALWLAARELPSLAIPSAAPPAFLLDSRRRLGDRSAGPGMFDNRWLSFPTDFPSARMLQNHGIRSALLITNDSADPATDLAHTLLRWQQGGMALQRFRLGIDPEPQPLTVRSPNLFRAAWYQFTTALGLRRNLLGGYGGRVPEPGSAG